VALTAFQKRKLARLFDAMDVNGDGQVGRTDFVHRVNALARLRGWHATSASFERNLRTALNEWQNLRETADVDDDTRVSCEEFLRYADVFLGDREAIRAYARGDVQLLFDAMDADGDGRITNDEYRTYLETCGLNGAGADSFFAHADLDEDGRVSRSEMTHAMEEYLSSDNPDAGGNYLFGPLD
jgi:juvenile hormone diol kinase